MEVKKYFKNSKNIRLCGILSHRNGDVNDWILILCHGFFSSKESHTNLAFQNELNKNGLASFRFDFTGFGESEGKWEDLTVSNAVDDILCAIQFLKGQGFLKIGVIGSSFGGLASIIAISRTDAVSLLALKSPVSDFQEILICKMKEEGVKFWESNGFIYMDNEKSKKLNYSFYQDLENNSGFIAADEIKVPTLIVHGSQDETVPIKQSQKLKGLIKTSSLKIIEGADHQFSELEHFKKMIDLIKSFILENCISV